MVLYRFFINPFPKDAKEPKTWCSLGLRPTPRPVSDDDPTHYRPSAAGEDETEPERDKKIDRKKDGGR